MTCQHKRGGRIEEMGYWLCADCLAKLETRPSRYGMKYIGFGPNPDTLRQDIVWQAEYAKADGTLFSDFVRTMTRRIIQRTRPKMKLPDAYNAAIDMLKAMLPDRFGDPAYGWDCGCARELVDMEMDNWDETAGGEGN